MDLQHIDVSAQTLDTSVDCVENVLARQTGTVDPGTVVTSTSGDGRLGTLVVDAEETLGHNHHAVAGDVVFLQCLTHNLLRAAVGVDVGLFVIVRMIGWPVKLWIMDLYAHRIPGVDTLSVRVLDQRQGIFFIENPILPLLASKAHGTQDNLGYLQTRFSETISR